MNVKDIDLGWEKIIKNMKTLDKKVLKVGIQEGDMSADGSVGRSMDPNQTYEVTIALATTSKTNDYFSNVYNLDRSTGRGILPLTIKDLSGTTVFQANQAWITNFPEHKRGRKIEAQEWVFHTGQVANPMIGGND